MSNREAGASLATFSLVLGLVSFFCVGLPAIPAVVLGHIALGHIGSAATSDARGRAWVGLILGYINLSIFGVLGLLMAIGFAVSPEDEVPVALETAVSVDEAAPPLPEAAQGATRDDDLYLVEGDGRYHTFFCRLTSDADAQRTRLADALDAGFTACEVCQPGQR